MAMIIPQYKLILTYNIEPSRQQEYMQFVLGTFVPAIQEMGLYLLGVYHTVVGDYPDRQAEYVSESWEIMDKAINSDRFVQLEEALKSYTTDYSRKIVKYRKGFQL
jgi:hypothetical protein